MLQRRKKPRSNQLLVLSKDTQQHVGTFLTNLDAKSLLITNKIALRKWSKYINTTIITSPMLVRLQSPQVVAMLKGSTKVIICLDEKENKLHHDHVMFIKDLIQPTVSELVLCCEFWGSFQFPFNLLECCHQLETFTIMGDVFDSDDDQTLEVEECQLKFFNRLCKQLEQLPEFKLLVSHRVVNDVARCDVFDFTPDAAPLQSPPDQWETQQWEQTVVVENEMKQCQHTILTHQINEQIIGIDLSAKWKFPFWEERRKHWQTLDDLVRAAPPLKLTRQNACCL